jgi:hypothetical protein
MQSVREVYMSDESWPNRPHEDRGDETLHDNGMVRSIIDRLDVLERETRPSSGDATSNDKDLKSREAIACAADLILYLAGWAIDHQQGVAMRGLKSYGQEPMSDSTYVDEKKALDSHENECVAVVSNKRGRDLPPERQREFSVQMLELLGDYIFPKSLAEALRALDFGEVQPILQKAEGDKRNYTERTAQLRALEYIEFETAKGTLKNTARQMVGSHFKHGVEAIRKWETPVREALGGSLVSRALLRAREDGELVKCIKMRPDASQFRLFFENRYYYRMQMGGKAYCRSREEKQDR